MPGKANRVWLGIRGILLIIFLVSVAVDVLSLGWIYIAERTEPLLPPVETPAAETKAVPRVDTAQGLAQQARGEPAVDRSSKNSNGAPDHSGEEPPGNRAPRGGGRSRFEPAVPYLLLYLVVVLLAIPFGWNFLFYQRSREEEGKPTKDDYLAWFTAHGAPFLILGFALLVEYESLLEGRIAGVGAIAGIMILYSLSMLASFLYLEVRTVKGRFDAAFERASDWFRMQLKLSEAESGQPTPALGLAKLLKAWSSVYVASKGGEGQAESWALTRNAMGTLISAYMTEEARDVLGSLSPSSGEIPPAVWPWGSEALPTNKEGLTGVSFMASNVGFYAEYLSASVQHLGAALGAREELFLATITFAPPPLWWNWPEDSSGTKWAFWRPIDDYRRVMARLAGGDGATSPKLRAYRKVILAKEGWDSQLLYKVGDWHEMETWCLMGKGSKGKTEILSSRDCSAPKKVYHELHGRSKVDELIPQLAWTYGEASGEKNGRWAYWMVKRDPFDEKDEPLRALRVFDQFSKLMHPDGRGYTQAHFIDEATFSDPLFGDDVSNPGLNGCGELLFLGAHNLSPAEDDVWQLEEDPKLALALLATMSKNSETMFMTVVWDHGLVSRLWRKVRHVATKRFGEGVPVR